MVKSGKQARRSGTLAESPSHLMHRALQLALDIYSEEAGDGGPTQRQFAVMEAVSVKAGLTQTELVRATGIDRSTLADLVARMTTKGLLSRERSTLDARAKAVRLSRRGPGPAGRRPPEGRGRRQADHGPAAQGQARRLPRHAGRDRRRRRRGARGRKGRGQGR